MGLIKGFKPKDKGLIDFTTFAGTVPFAEGSNISVGTSTGTQIGTSATQKLAFWGSTPVVRPSHIANITTTATTGSLPTANSAVTISNAATPTVGELLEYCVELETKVEAILTALRNLGLLASS